MPVEEFARLYYAMSRVLEHATEGLKLSKRSGIVLWLLAQADEGSIENKELVKKFAAWQVSKTHEGAARDVSLANAELDKAGLISMRLSPYRACLTEEGRAMAKRFLTGIEEAITATAMKPEQRSLLVALVLGQVQRIPVQRADAPGQPVIGAGQG